ncbi:MAG: non-ribosomal peptide synthetase, partial [Enterobacteriaceae bacterium]
MCAQNKEAPVCPADKESLSSTLLPHWIERVVQQSHSHPAVIFENSILTYNQLNQRSNQLAHYLSTQGVGAESLVAVCMERSLEMVIGLLAIIKAGAAYIPLDPDYPSERLQYMLQDSEATLLLVQQKYQQRLPQSDLPHHIVDLKQWCYADYPDNNLDTTLHENNLAYVIYTSGSTGRPKGVGISHAAIVNRLCWMQQSYQLTAEDRVLQKTPLSFDVSVWELFWPLISGAVLVIAKPGGHRDPAYLCHLIASQAITTLHFVPPMLSLFLDKVQQQQIFTLKRVICSGQALSYQLQQRFFICCPRVSLHNLYGPTEAAVDVTAWQCDATLPLSCVPIGYPISNIELYILDQQLQPVAPGVEGTLYIAGVGLARGYLHRPELTAEKFIANPLSQQPGMRMYDTGDLARYLPGGAIEYLGRHDHQIKLRGFRIEAGEIESALMAIEGIKEAVVVEWQDNAGEQQLVAYLLSQQEKSPGSESLRDGELRTLLTRTLPDYMVPAF